MWDTNDLDFDSDGKLIIKNGDLAARLRQLVQDKGYVVVDMNGGCALDYFCPIPVVPRPGPPPDGMCVCLVQDLGQLIKSRGPGGPG